MKILVITILLATILTSSGCAVSRTTGAGKKEFALLHYESTQTHQTTAGVGNSANNIPGSNDHFTDQHAKRSVIKEEKRGPSSLFDK